jgi:hypothetical protein
MRGLLAAVLMALFASPPMAQTVYKCESKGSVVYTHEPCLGAKAVDTTATQGLDKSSGQSKKGADVRKIENNKAVAEALRPLFNETPVQREVRHRRFNFPLDQKLECGKLDHQIPVHEASLRNADKAGAAKAELVLFESRRRFRELRC